ncbi:putative helicase mov-10-B.1 isoform X1 [Sander lucioperca]|uniref:putative helicase mov-10-B.1 isoform X1 n=2 Tax=Sander lucioperca TaxID=283035 RepID=UPI001653D16C|nr:putative helicase mov-10-B.1 isoform X1 [Sander lucioperca]XP_035864329.1 putative helicase mov-10-B.1 isoform X1 [Sander lucioperca]
MFSANKYHQDQISLLLCKCSKQLQMSPAAVHSVQNAGPGKSGYLNGPQNKFNDEAQMAQQAHQNIQARLKMAKLFQQYRAQLISNKHVTVTSDPPSKEEKIYLTVYENKKVVPLTVKNCGVKTVNLTFWTFDLVKNIFTVRDCHGNLIQTMKRLPLGPGESYKLKVHFDSEHAGFYEQLLVFQVESRQQSSDKFEIMRILEVIHWTSFSEEPLPTATTSVSDLQTMNWTPAKGVGLTWLKLVVPLKAYPMPDNMKDPKKADKELEKMPLNWGTYCRRFQTLLHVEELQLKTDIEKFNRNATMFRHKSNAFLLILQLAGVYKNSPMMLFGNNVLVTPLNQPGVFENEVYNGWVHHVDAEHVYLQFSEEFLNCFKEGTRYRFNFYLGRMPLRIQHRAVQLAYTSRLKEVLFPTGRFSSHHSHLHRLIELGDNPEQQKAVQHIVAASAKPAPYLVFGPPGTGKTVTLVEAIKRIVEMQPSCNILVCTPSNSATDHLFEKILEGKIGEHEAYRLFALSCPVRNIPQNIKSCCNLNRKTNTLMMPPKEELMKYKIMATTLLTAGRLVTGGIPVDHYTYIFVDEAGQATETECIVPIAGLLKKKCQVVLAGDPKQLGAIITSRVAEKHGLGVSLLERLMNDISLYMSHETHGFNNRFVTKLLRNYRSHPAILKIPNELFYNGELQPYAHKEKCNSYCKWERLPKKGFPLIFHGVAGTDERDASSPSVYNMAEVEVLKEYLKTLVDHLKRKGVTKIQPREIGIIAPYRKQVEKIQNALKTDKDLMKINLENVLVGSVEQFQGKEFNVILVSTVRSNPKLTAHMQRFTIGFVDNEKRFNVAMTRARALLIVVGDPRVLKTDQIWNKFIYYCLQQGAYRGIIVSDAEEEESPLTNVHSPSLCEE